MSVSIDEVKHVAMLARLGLTEERAQALTRDMNTILEHMTVLESVKTPSSGGLKPLLNPLRLRRDESPSAPLSAPPSAFAPEMREGLFIVPRLATHEDAESA